jgi:hypothetical protein
MLFCKTSVYILKLLILQKQKIATIFYPEIKGSTSPPIFIFFLVFYIYIYICMFFLKKKIKKIKFILK